MLLKRIPALLGGSATAWGWRSTIAFVVLLGLAICSTLAPAAAQQADIDSTYKQFQKLYAARDFAGALIEAQRLEAGIKAQFGANSTNYAAALSNLAIVYSSLGKDGEAEGLHKRALAIRERALGESHPEVAQTLVGLGIDLSGIITRSTVQSGIAFALGQGVVDAGWPAGGAVSGEDARFAQ